MLKFCNTVSFQSLNMLFLQLLAVTLALIGDTQASPTEEIHSKPESAAHGHWSTDNKLQKIMKGKYEKFHKADPRKYLSIARILKDGNDHCLATVADRDALITAAHCVADFTSPAGMARLRVVAGDFVGWEKDDAEQSVKVKEVIIHENYK